MKLKNSALQELYDTLVSGGVSMSHYADSPVYEAFKECDEKISESATFAHIKKLEDRCENLERSNKALRDINNKLSDKTIELKKDIDICKCSNEMLLASSMESISEKRKLENEIEDLKKDRDAKTKENSTLVSANADLSDRNAKLQRNFDRINHLWTGQIQENTELKSKIVTLKREKEELASLSDEISDLKKKNKDLERNLGVVRSARDAWRSRAEESEKRFGELLLKKYDQSFEDLKKDLDNAKKQLTYFTQSRDDWRSRAKHAEGEVEDLKKEKEEAEKELDIAKRNRDGWKSRAMHTEKRYAELRKENADLPENVVDLKKRITELQKKGDDLTKKGEDLQQDIEELKKSRKHLRRLYVGEGARKLWEMLQNVNDSQPNEFDVECESMEDVISMDLDDFLDAYKKGQEEKEQKETDRMRRWLDDFCTGRLCSKCPLNEDEFKCGRGYSFAKRDRFDNRIIPDEDIKRYYEKARGDDDATFYYDNKPVIMGGTLEVTVEVDKNLLAKVCGVKHKLDYGDAVRVPWKSYDYMYIEPEGKHIRLFDPKTHAVVLVSVKDTLTYQGYTIILCDEDDIRKIWKDKK